tara:strand:+ start:374 stop:634 length:261 start_codon:yes stop_codon:yes gene_type:complete
MKIEFILYIRNSCPFCIKAKVLLEENHYPFRSLALDDYQHILEGIKDLYDWQTVPMIFKKDGNNYHLIGGYSDLVAYLRQKEGLNV